MDLTNKVEGEPLNTPNIVLIGVGKFGKNHLRVLKELDEEGVCNLKGVVDVKGKTLETLNKRYKTSVDFHDFLKDDVDAVDIVTPTSTHYAISKEWLAAGKHVFVEKPLTTSFNEANELVRIAEEQGKILMAGHIFRYNLAVRKIKKLVEEGELGQIYYLSGRFDGIKDPKIDVGALFNYTAHHIDTYNYLLQELPEEVTCCVGFFLGRNKFEDLALLTLKYPSNAMGIVEGSWLPPGKRRDLIVVGSRKSVTSNLIEQTIQLHDIHMEPRNGKLRAVSGDSQNIEIEFKEPLKLELQDFIECARDGCKPVADGKAAMNVVKIGEKALESARLKRSVKIDAD